MGESTVAVDPVMVRIGEGLALSGRGLQAEARSVFDDVWQDVGPQGDPFHRCAVAHSLADVQDDPHQELHWDLVALRSADEITGERARAGGVGDSVAGFYPSLHLNLGDVYRRLGNAGLARQHLALGLEALDGLGDDGYATLIRGGLERLAARIGS